MINKIYARWKLANAKQREGESMDAFVNSLIVLAKDCNFADFTAIRYKKESLSKIFISGLKDPYIRQRILEKDADLEGALELAELLKGAKTDAGCYESEKNLTTVAVIDKIESKYDLVPEDAVNSVADIDQIAAMSRTSRTNNTKLVKCQNCGIQHPVQKCSAFGKAYFDCGKLNHYTDFCKKTKQATFNSLLAA